MSKGLKSIFTATALAVPVLSVGAAFAAGYTLPMAIIIGGGTSLSAAFGGAVCAFGGIGASALLTRKKQGFEGLGPAVFGGVVGGAIGIIAGGLLGFNALNTSFSDVDSIDIRVKSSQVLLKTPLIEPAVLKVSLPTPVIQKTYSL